MRKSIISPGAFEKNYLINVKKWCYTNFHINFLTTKIELEIKVIKNYYYFHVDALKIKSYFRYNIFFIPC